MNNFIECQQRYFLKMLGKNFSWRTKNKIISALESEMLSGIDGSVIVEVGCGTGVNVSLITNGKSKVIGIDFLKEAIDFASKNTEGTFICADGLACPLKRCSVDTIICRDTLHHLQDREKGKFISELYSAIKSGGRLYLTEPNPGNPFIWFHGKLYPAERNVLKNDIPSISKLLVEGGFEVSETKMFEASSLRAVFHPTFGLPIVKNTSEWPVVQTLANAFTALCEKAVPKRFWMYMRFVCVK